MLKTHHRVTNKTFYCTAILINEFYYCIYIKPEFFESSF